jgi:hypothetical protein
MKLHKKYLSIALIGLVCLPAGCGQGGSAQSAIPPAPTTTTLPVDQYPKTQIYFAPDIDPMVQDRVRITVAGAEEIWGPVKDLEIWVTGLDPNAALTFRDEFCVIRKKTDTESMYCDYKADKNTYLFVDFANQSKKGRKTYKDNGPLAFFHAFSKPSGYIVMPYPHGLASKWPVPSELDQITIFHEYFHAVQEATRNLVEAKPFADYELMTGWMKEATKTFFKYDLLEPRWFMEGLAIAMSENYVLRLRKEGKIDVESDKGTYKPDLTTSLSGFLFETLYEVGELLEAEPNLRLKHLTGSENGRTPYVFGIWAINYLMVESGPDVFLNNFYPAIQELGWEKAFYRTFGKSIDQFYTDFDQFIRQPQDDLVQFLISSRVDSW